MSKYFNSIRVDNNLILADSVDNNSINQNTVEIKNEYTTSGQHNVTIPTGCIEIFIKAFGSGAGGGLSGATGGGGGYADSTISVIGGDNFILYVGDFGEINAVHGNHNSENIVEGGSGGTANCGGGGQATFFVKDDGVNYITQVISGGGGGGCLSGGIGGGGNQSGTGGGAGLAGSGGVGGSGQGTPGDNFVLSVPIGSGLTALEGRGANGIIGGIGGGGSGYGGGAAAVDTSSGSGGGGNFAINGITTTGNFQTPGNSTDPDLNASLYATGGGVNANGLPGFAVIYFRFRNTITFNKSLAITEDLRLLNAVMPATGIETGINKSIRFDGDYVYYATADNTWKTISIVDFQKRIIDDTDGDTSIDLELTTDDDTIRFNTTSTERMTITDTETTIINNLNVNDVVNSFTTIGTVDGGNGNNIQTFQVHDNYLYGCDRLNPVNFMVFDLSIPTAPTKISEIALGNSGALGMDIKGQYCYVPRNLGVDIININDPFNPVISSFITIGTNFNKDLKVQGNYLYIADNGPNIFVYNISDIAVPILIETFNTINPATSIYIKGNYAYITTNGSGDRKLIILDISDPYNLILKGTIQLNVGTGVEGFLSSATVNGSYVYVYASFTPLNQFYIIDITDPDTPVLLSTNSLNTDNANAPQIIQVFGKILYMVNKVENRIRTYDITDPTAPSLLVTHTITLPDAVYVDGKYIYVSFNSGNIDILESNNAYIQNSQMGTLKVGQVTVDQDLRVNNNLMVNSSIIANKGIVSYDSSSINKNLKINGGFQKKSREETSGVSFSLELDDYLVEVSTTNNINVTLPLASIEKGREYVIVKTGASGTITVIRSGSNTIDNGGTTTHALTTQYDKVKLISNGNSIWYIT
jgi:hypothetical protein